MNICPCCGYNLERETPVERDGWELTYYSARYYGAPVDISAAQAYVLYSLARAYPRHLTAEVLGNRVSNGTNVANIAAIQISKVRHKLGNLCPIVTKKGLGYQWKAAA